MVYGNFMLRCVIACIYLFILHYKLIILNIWGFIYYLFILYRNRCYFTIIFYDDDDEVWHTTTYAVDIICTYYVSYIHKKPCIASFQTELMWCYEIMRDNKKRYINLFIMDNDTLIKLSIDLE